MERDRRIYLCVKSLLNISMDLKDDFNEYSDMILFIADRIADKMQREIQNDVEKFGIHENGKIHDMTVYEQKIYDKDDKIEREIDEAIEEARMELNQVEENV